MLESVCLDKGGKEDSYLNLGSFGGGLGCGFMLCVLVFLIWDMLAR